MADNNDSLLAKLDEIDARFNEIEKQISDPEVASNTNKLIALSKEQGKIRAMVTKYGQYKKAVAGIEEAQQILDDGGAEKDFKELAKEDLQEFEGQKDTLL